MVGAAGRGRGLEMLALERGVRLGGLTETYLDSGFLGSGAGFLPLALAVLAEK